MVRQTKEREIKALVSMVDEPDPKVFQEISGKILHHGQDAMPFLERFLEQMTDDGLRRRVELLMLDIRYNSILLALKKHVLNDDHN